MIVFERKSAFITHKYCFLLVRVAIALSVCSNVFRVVYSLFFPLVPAMTPDFGVVDTLKSNIYWLGKNNCLKRGLPADK
jgi:hypothetical protein